MPRLVNTVDEKTQQAVRKVIEHMQRLIRLKGESMRSLEQRIGLSSSLLSKILKGKSRLTLEHFLQIMAALDVHPAPFFGWVFPGASQANELLERAGATEDGRQRNPLTDPAAAEQLVAKVLARLIAKAAEEGV